MPQRQFWTSQIPVEFRIRYTIDPTDHDAPAFVAIESVDQGGAVIERSGCRIPLNVVHECMIDVMHEAWEAYLFGELGGLQRAISPVIKRWRRHSADRPLWS